MLIFGEFLKQIFICFSIQPTKFTEHPKKLKAWNWVNKSELNIKHGMAGIWSTWQIMTQTEKVVFLRHGCSVCSIDQMDIFMVLDKYLANISETSGDSMWSTRVLVIKLSKVDYNLISRQNSVFSTKPHFLRLHNMFMTQDHMGFLSDSETATLIPHLNTLPL